MMIRLENNYKLIPKIIITKVAKYIFIGPIAHKYLVKIIKWGSHYGTSNNNNVKCPSR